MEIEDNSWTKMKCKGWNEQKKVKEEGWNEVKSKGWKIEDQPDEKMSYEREKKSTIHYPMMRSNLRTSSKRWKWQRKKMRR